MSRSDLDYAVSPAQCQGLRLAMLRDGVEVGRVRLYILWNELHKRPFGLGEDLYVEPVARGKGYARKLLLRLVEEAKRAGCYKLIVTSRYSSAHIHKMCLDVGFGEYGLEFRLDGLQEDPVEMQES